MSPRFVLYLLPAVVVLWFCAFLNAEDEDVLGEQQRTIQLTRMNERSAQAERKVVSTGTGSKEVVANLQEEEESVGDELLNRKKDIMTKQKEAVDETEKVDEEEPEDEDEKEEVVGKEKDDSIPLTHEQPLRRRNVRKAISSAMRMENEPLNPRLIGGTGPSPHNYTDPLTGEPCELNSYSHKLLTMSEIQQANNFSCKRHVVFSAMKCVDTHATSSCTCTRQFMELTAVTHAATMSPAHVSFLYVPEQALVRNKYRLPTLKSFYQYAYDTCPNAATYTYFNADILFDSLFVDTVEAALQWASKEKIAGNPSEFLLAGPRYDTKFDPRHMDVSQLRNFRISPTNVPVRNAKNDECHGIDYFIATRNAIDWEDSGAAEMVIGRPAFDVWLVDRTYRSTSVALISARSMFVRHLIDRKNNTNSNSQWMKNTVEDDDKNYNQLRLWKGPPYGKRGWVADWGQFGYPCSAHHQAVLVELSSTTETKSSPGHAQIAIAPNRKQSIFFRNYDTKEYQRTRLVHWRRRHQPVITTTIIIIARDLKSIQSVYEFLRHKTVFDLFTNDTHRIDLSFRLASFRDTIADINEKTRMKQWLDLELGSKSSWPYGQWESVFSQHSKLLKFHLLSRTKGWLAVNRFKEIVAELKIGAGQAVISKHTIVIDSSDFMETQRNTPPSWYRWFHKARRNTPSYQGMFLYASNKSFPTTAKQTSTSTGDVIKGSPENQAPFAWSFNTSTYRQYVKNNLHTWDSLHTVPSELQNYKDFCMYLSDTVTSCEFLDVIFRPAAGASTASSPRHPPPPPEMVTRWVKRAHCPTKHSLYRLKPLNVDNCQQGIDLIDEPIVISARWRSGRENSENNGHSPEISGLNLESNQPFMYTNGLRHRLGRMWWQGCTVHCRQPLHVAEPLADNQLTSAEVAVFESEFV